MQTFPVAAWASKSTEAQIKVRVNEFPAPIVAGAWLGGFERQFATRNGTPSHWANFPAASSSNRAAIAGHCRYNALRSPSYGRWTASDWNRTGQQIKQPGTVLASCKPADRKVSTITHFDDYPITKLCQWVADKDRVFRMSVISRLHLIWGNVAEKAILDWYSGNMKRYTARTIEFPGKFYMSALLWFLRLLSVLYAGRCKSAIFQHGRYDCSAQKITYQDEYLCWWIPISAKQYDCEMTAEL